MSSALFSSFKLRSVEFLNRIVVSPMGQCSAEDGCANDWHKVHLGGLALQGSGALVIEATAVNPEGRNTPFDLGLWNDTQAEALAPSIDFIRRHSRTKLGLQLWHVGRKGSVMPAWERHRLLPISEGGWQVFAASDIPYPGRHIPVPMDKEHIAGLLSDYRAAAKRADLLGVEFLELHAAHGYLLHNFLSPLTNHRQDEYGGSLENRLRLVLEVFAAIREVLPEHKPLGIRISSTDWVKGGWTLDDSVVLATRLKALGCDYVTASSGGAVPEQDITIGPGYQVPFSTRIRREAGIATIAVGLITDPRHADSLIANGHADLVALARGMIFNPRWTWHAAVELGAEPDFPVQYERAHPAMRKTDFLKAKRDT
jgi:2,4-dienoyl-CoA reductase-like NADH-dependent reductase (Old Yellow Enzyme family)